MSEHDKDFLPPPPPATFKYDNAPDGGKNATPLILGIIGLIIGFGFILGTIGLVMAIKEKNQGNNHSTIKAGFIVCIISIIWSIVATIITVFILIWVFNNLDYWISLADLLKGITYI